MEDNLRIYNKRLKFNFTKIYTDQLKQFEILMLC